MGTLGTYLSSAREAMGHDLHESAQQTRISIHYLKALEQEDFSKLPGEVFVKGFLKNYAHFLNLPEEEVMKRYHELRPQPKKTDQGESFGQETVSTDRKKPAETPVEPVIWGSIIFIAIVVFLFTSLPGKQNDTANHPPAVVTQSEPAAPSVQGAVPEKLYLKIVAVDDVWLLVRTDTSPQKKAVLKTGESVTWSAEKRFLLSYGNVDAVKLLLNDEELEVSGPKGAVVRDLIITASGVVSKKFRERQPRRVTPRPKPQSQTQSGQAQPQPAPTPMEPERQPPEPLQEDGSQE